MTRAIQVVLGVLLVAAVLIGVKTMVFGAETEDAFAGTGGG